MAVAGRDSVLALYRRLLRARAFAFSGDDIALRGNYARLAPSNQSRLRYSLESLVGFFLSRCRVAPKDSPRVY